MATINRSYHIVGPNAADLQRFAGPTAVFFSSETATTVTITVDNTADAIQALDDYMSKCGFAPGNSQLQVFEYTFTGVEGTHFVVALPAARASAAFGVTWGPQTDPDTYGWSWDTPTVNNFMLRTSGQVPVNKKITFFVMDLQ